MRVGRGLDDMRFAESRNRASILKSIGIRGFAALFFLMNMIGTATSIFGAADNVSRDVVALTAARLEASYVFPTRAHEAANLLRRNADAGIYDNLQARALADRITADILSTLHDKHVRVFYEGDTVTPLAQSTSPAPPNRDMLNGLAEISHLAGNIGYIDLRGFVPATEDSARMLDAAMDAVASSDAIILDLRKNHGGDPKSIARLLSHVLPPNTHLIDFIGRDGKIQQSTSTIALPTTTISAPLYVLTSAQTFSAGEECAYDLQTLKRATLVGAVTGGGANPGGDLRIDDHFFIFVPDATSRSPITMTNWEGTGVRPDVAVPADRALVTAYGMALSVKLHAATVSSSLRENLTSVGSRIEGLTDAELFMDFGESVSVGQWPEEVPVSPALLSDYAGVYQGPAANRFVIALEGGRLGSKLGEEEVVPLYAESESTFFEKVFNAEIRFFRDPVTHAITHLTLYQNGRQVEFDRLSDRN
jgi:hypothetical protein